MYWSLFTVFNEINDCFSKNKGTKKMHPISRFNRTLEELIKRNQGTRKCVED